MRNIDDNTMQHRLYDILKMNIKLAKESNTLSAVPMETFDSFKQACKKIDSFNHERYETELASLYTVTTTLEEEKERLEKLVRLISDRIEERNKLVNEYQELTFKILDGLDSITDMTNLDMYRNRLDSIREYLDNNKNIVATEEELKNLNADLEKAIIQKSKDEDKNYDLEDNILVKFRNILMSNDAYSDMTGVIDVDYELEKIEPNVLETKKTLDTFEKAFLNLKKAGISSQTEIEYSIYVSDAKETYYQTKEKEFFLRIYKLLLDSKNEYSELFSKRESLDKILKERMTLRKKLELNSVDILSELYDVIEEQKIHIKEEKINIDSIKKLSDKIAFKERRLEGYKEANQKVDILTILQEYGIIETYISDIPSTVEEPIVTGDTLSFGDLDDGIDKEVQVIEPEPLDPYAIKNVEEAPEEMNISFFRNKANTVMRRVGKALGYEVPKVEVVIPKIEEPIVSVDIPVVEEIIAEPVQPNVPEIEVKEVEVPMFTVEPIEEKKEEPPKVEEPKNDIFEQPMADIFEVKKGVRPEVMPDVPPPEPVFEPKTNEVEEKKEEPKINTFDNLFWPESKPLFPSDIKLDSSLDNSFVTMNQPFPEEKGEDEFNPQALNVENDFVMPDIPMGDLNLSSGPGTLSSPMKIRRM